LAPESNCGACFPSFLGAPASVSEAGSFLLCHHAWPVVRRAFAAWRAGRMERHHLTVIPTEATQLFLPISLPVRWLGCAVEGPLFSFRAWVPPTLPATRTSSGSPCSGPGLQTGPSQAPQPSPTPQPAPLPHTPLPSTSTEFIQHVVAGLQTGEKSSLP